MEALQRITESTTFDQLVQNSFEIWTQRNPTAASGIGLADYDNRWPDVSESGIKQDISIIYTMKSKLEKIDARGLKPTNQQDYYLLNWFLEISLFELRDLRFWQHNPRLSSLILGGINQLVVREHPSLTERLDAIISRLKQVGDLVKPYLNRISTPVRIWVDAEIRSVNGLMEYLTRLPSFFPSAREDQLESLKDLVGATKNTILEYRDKLELLDTQEEIPTNEELFSILIEKRKIGYNVDEIEDLGRNYLEQTEKHLNDLVKIIPGESIDEVRASIRGKHATTFDKVMENYRVLAQQARKLIREKDLLTLPKEQLKVIPTPTPLRHFLSIAAAGPPGKFEPDQTGYFYCTPHEDEKMLQEHSFAYQPLLISHESYPGHHVHGACKNQHPSLIRSTIFSSLSANTGLMYNSKLAEVTEGWGLYCEKMMFDQGFENDPENPDLEQKFLQINAKRWRATRMIIDINLHTGRMSYQEAVEFLISQTGYNRTTAEAEVLMYSQSPGYFLSYLLGQHLILQLWEEVKDRMGQKEFHDLILYAGSVPFWFLKKHVFGIE